jgi:hypothetical protein
VGHVNFRKHTTIGVYGVHRRFELLFVYLATLW